MFLPGSSSCYFCPDAPLLTLCSVSVILRRSQSPFLFSCCAGLPVPAFRPPSSGFGDTCQPADFMFTRLDLYPTLGASNVTGSSLFLFGSALCEVVDDRPFPLSKTVYNTFVFGGRSVVSEHIGYYTDRKGNDIVLENNW